MCISYHGTLKLKDDISEAHTVPLMKWIEEKVVFKVCAKQSRVRDLHSDNSGEMVHMFSILVGRSQHLHLSFHMVSAIHHSLMDFPQ